MNSKLNTLKSTTRTENSQPSTLATLGCKMVGLLFAQRLEKSCFLRLTDPSWLIFLNPRSKKKAISKLRLLFHSPEVSSSQERTRSMPTKRLRTPMFNTE